MRAYVFVNVQTGKVDQVIRAFGRIAGVKAAEACWGRPDIIAHVEATDQKELSALVMSTMQRIPGVVSTDTHIVVES